MSTKRLRIGTRGSPLALAQAHETKSRLARAHPALAGGEAIDIVVIKTTGDRILDRPLSEIGGKGLFTKELDEALLDRRIDLAVHSMKDVPTWLPDGTELVAMLPREDPRDAFFAAQAGTLDDLPEGAVVGTASLRRQAQVLARRPDLKVVTFRGNVATRLRKLAEGEVDATLLAVAGLRRLDHADLVKQVLEPDVMLPAVAQGAIGLQCRSDDDRTVGFCRAISDSETLIRVTAERAMLRLLDGSCRTPIAALATRPESDGGGTLALEGLIAQPDGTAVHRAEASAPVSGEDALGAADALGRSLGEELLGRAGPDFLATPETPSDGSPTVPAA